MATARKPTLRGRRLARSLWQIVRIYWTSPDAKWGALLLAGAVTLEFATVQTTFYVSDLQRQTVESLEHRDASAFLTMAGFFIGLSLILIVVSALRVYLRQLLEIRWRRGLTGDFIARWI
jgi:putative ATP-binding cassette transporter